MVLRLCLLGLAAAVCAAAPAAASSRYEVHLLTMSPGDHPFERFGHTALGVKDRQAGSELVYNFGTFDFEDPQLWKKALSKELGYWVSSMNPGLTALRYAQREIRTQQLALSDEQAAALVRRLAEVVGPERRTFAYDQFTNNCVTRVRDLLDEATGGALRRYGARPAGRTFRQEVLLTLQPAPVMVAMAQVVYGPYTDRPRTRWESLFLPHLLHDALSEITLEDGAGRRPLVATERVWRDEEYSPPGPLPDPVPVVAALLLALIVVIAIGRRRGAPAAVVAALGGAGALLALLSGALGLLLICGGMTPHAWFQHNGNRLLLSPLDLLVAPLLCLAAAGRLGRRGRALLLGLLGAGLALAAGHAVGADLSGRCLQVHGALLPVSLGLRTLLVAAVALIPRRPLALRASAPAASDRGVHEYAAGSE